jgi:hypothetical protein
LTGFVPAAGVGVPYSQLFQRASITSSAFVVSVTVPAAVPRSRSYGVTSSP